MPTKQQTFNTVVRAMLKQGRRSMSEDSRCVYRGENDTMCAVGCLIDDDEYDEKWDDPNAADTNILACLSLKALMIKKGHDIFLLQRLQGAHDRSVDPFVEAFTENARRVALHLGLSTKTLDRAYAAAKKLEAS